jgi:hypothetical protein
VTTDGNIDIGAHVGCGESGAQQFPFAFVPRYRLAALMFGITPATAWVEVDDRDFDARFGP